MVKSFFLYNYIDSWSHIALLAGNVCGDPPNINNGKVQMDSETVNVTAFYTCDKGFVKIGEESIACLPSGKWVKATIKCGR